MQWYKRNMTCGPWNINHIRKIKEQNLEGRRIQSSEQKQAYSSQQGLDIHGIMS